MTDEDRLQEYLDGRMSDAERREFESMLARNPDLADRVRSAREIGRLLRNNPPDLPEGFLARARSRFEASTRPVSKPARRIPWEVWGLAAATLVVAVLLFPRQRVVGPPRALPPAEVSQDRGVPADSRNEPRPLPPAAVEVPQGGDRAILETARRPAEEKRKAAPDSGPIVAANDAAPSPGESDAASRPAEVDKGLLDDSLAIPTIPSPSTPAAQSAGASASPARFERADGPRRETRAASIPAGTLAGGYFVVIASADDDLWKAFLAGASGIQARELAPNFDSERVLVFGPREASFSCSGVTFQSRSDGVHVFAMSPGENRPASPGGCMVVIPRGNDEVRLELIPRD